MKRLVNFFAAALWALGLAIASAAYADPPSIIGRLNHLNGPVSFAPGEAPDEWVAAQLNRPVTGGDRLWTDNNGFAEIRVGSLAMRMAPQTSMDILALDDRAIQLRVAQGNLNLRVRRALGDRFIEVATPTGAVVIRQPGSYRISVDPQGDFALVSVRMGGQAEVFTADASVLVRDNEEAELSGGRPELYAAAQLDEFDRWASDRDRRFDRIGSTRYVSMEMTGYEDLDYYGQWRTVGQYGNVWIPDSLPDGWAPYRYGHWVWVSPWGWTWVDDQPWGFAPAHYGRWVWVDNYWAWAPGRIVERPVYSPALVAFIGGAALSVGISSGPSVGWVPLGYREPYIPWYTASRTYVQNVNIAYNVTNVTNVTNVRYVNRSVPNAVTVVPRQTFVAAQPVQRQVIRVDNRQIATAPITREAPVARPERTSLVRAESGSRPPAQVLSREAVTVYKPAAPQRQLIVSDTRDDRPAQKGERRGQRDDRRAPAVAAATTQLPPVRVIERREPTRPQVQATPPRAENRAARQVTVTQAPRADAPAPQPGVTGGQTRRQEQAREQQGDRIRDQKEQQTEQQKAQATQQLEQLEREKKQREGQAEQRQATERERGQKAAQDQQRQRQEQERAQREQQERERGQKAAQEQERERGQKAAQDQQRQRQEQERAQREQQERERGQKAAQERQRQEQSQREQQQRAAQEQQQRAQQEQQRQRQEQERAQREQSQKAAQEQQQRAQQEQQRQQQAAQQRAQQEQQRAQQQQAQKAAQEQQRAQQQAAQKAAQEQQRAAAQEQQRAQQQGAQKAAQEQQRAQQAAQQRQQQADEAEKGKRKRPDQEG